MQLRPPDLQSHAERLLEIQRAAYRVEADLIGDDRIPTLHETLDDLRAAPLSWLGAFDGDQLVGAVAWVAADRELDIDRLFVDPAAARRGIGRALVGAVVESAAGRDVVVSTGRDNAPAVALYESLGFHRLDDVEVLAGLWITRFRRSPAAACPARDHGPDRPA